MFRKMLLPAFMAGILTFLLTACPATEELKEITITSGSGGAVTYGTSEVRDTPLVLGVSSGSHLTFAAVPDEGYAFDVWGGLCAAETSAICSFDVSESGRLHARFTTLPTSEEPIPEKPEPEEPTPEEPVDVTAPTISLTAPPSGTTVTPGSQVNIRGTSSDNVGVVRIEVLANETLLGELSSSLSSWVFVWHPEAGTYVLSARAYDAAGNQGVSTTRLITVSTPPDTTNPTVAITSPADGSTALPGTEVVIRGIAQDDVALDRVEIITDGTVATTRTSSPWTYTWQPSEGRHTFTARAIDTAGNSATAPTRTITVETPPTPDPEPDPEPSPAIVLPPKPSAIYWQLQGTVPTNRSELVYDIDGFDNSAATFAALNNNRKYTIAYFSAGSWENWRPDANSFPTSIRGNNLDGWPGERWLDIRQVAILKPIMEARVAVAKAKGANAIEWDNLDLFNQNSGFSISQAQTRVWLQMLADITHEAGLAAIFKNTPELSSWAVNIFDGVITEEAYQYSEVSSYSAWYRSSKPMWDIEYRGTLNCSDAVSKGFYLARFPLDLNGAPVAVCPPP